MFIVAESVLEFLAPDLFGHGHGQSGHNSQTAFPLSVIAVSIVAKVVSYALSSRNFGSSGRVSRYSVSAHEHKHLTQTSQVKDLFKEGLVSISVFLCLFNQYCHFIDLDILEVRSIIIAIICPVLLIRLSHVSGDYLWSCRYLLYLAVVPLQRVGVTSVCSCHRIGTTGSCKKGNFGHQWRSRSPRTKVLGSNTR